MDDDSSGMKFVGMFLDNRDGTEYVRNGILQAAFVLTLVSVLIFGIAWGCFAVAEKFSEPAPAWPSR